MIAELKEKAREIRRDIINMCYQAQGAAHPGGALSAADVVAALYFKAMSLSDDPHWPDRDRLVLSKGHTAPVLYAALCQRGYFPTAWYPGLRGLGSRLQGHPDMQKTPGVDMTSGSLGNGLAVGAGMALGLKMDERPSFVYVILGDGEVQEGLVWEAAFYSGNAGLDNLVAIVDINGLQSCGKTTVISDPEPLDEKFRAFGWESRRIDGNRMEEVVSALEWAKKKEGKPKAILAHTVKGKGISFMEGNNSWHQRKLSEAEYRAALAELLC
ncbi:MAG: transketolase [Ruminococcaceae bacterium]|nr:transketolase [Oscillospiraceae bacterium]